MQMPEGQNTPRLTLKVTINYQIFLDLQSSGRRRTTSDTGLKNTFGEP